MKEAISAQLNCVYRTLSFIEQNYAQVISIPELEDVSHYSYRNIQRIFRYTCGETIGAYQKRLRVENAYKMMLYSNHHISAIALQVGFANLASFSKAFKQHYQLSPKQAKLQKIPLLAKADIFPIEATQELKPEILYVPAVKVYYRSAFINYEHEEIESVWDQFMKLLSPSKEQEFYGIIADEPIIRESLTCRYDTCCSMPSKDTALPFKTIAGGRYAQFSHYGDYENIEETYIKIYSGWILTAKLEFGTSPVIEKYIRHPDNSDAVQDQLTYIWLPLK